MQGSDNVRTAQDVIDALRIVATQDSLDVDVVRELLRHAPTGNEGGPNRGAEVLMQHLKTGNLRLEMVSF